MTPQCPDLLLTAHVPHGEGQSLDRRHGLHVEADGGDGANYLVQFDLVQNRGLACNTGNISLGVSITMSSLHQRL